MGARDMVESRLPDFLLRLRAEIPRYADAPESVLRDLHEAGVPEWWKGKEKNPTYWRFRPASLRRQLQEMEISAVYSMLDSLEEVLTGEGASALPSSTSPHPAALL